MSTVINQVVSDLPHNMPFQENSLQDETSEVAPGRSTPNLYSNWADLQNALSFADASNSVREISMLIEKRAAENARMTEFAWAAIAMSLVAILCGVYFTLSTFPQNKMRNANSFRPNPLDAYATIENQDWTEPNQSPADQLQQGSTDRLDRFLNWHKQTGESLK